MRSWSAPGAQTLPKPPYFPHFRPQKAQGLRKGVRRLRVGRTLARANKPKYPTLLFKFRSRAGKQNVRGLQPRRADTDKNISGNLLIFMSEMIVSALCLKLIT